MGNALSSYVPPVIAAAKGMIPGVGEFTAQFMSYTYAQRTSNRPEDFGRGSSEGLIAAETANNAVPAAAMVPLLALGIPGEALTAMMLSVFYVHNVVPGPGLFQTRMDFVVALYLALLILNLLVLVFLLGATTQLVKVVKILGTDNIADGLTKVLTNIPFNQWADRVMKKLPEAQDQE